MVIYDVLDFIESVRGLLAKVILAKTDSQEEAPLNGRYS
jgi:hypothetical protein